MEALGAVLVARNRLPQAEALYRRALAVREQTQAGEPERIALALRNLAALGIAQGRPGEAAPLMERARALSGD